MEEVFKVILNSKKITLVKITVTVDAYFIPTHQVILMLLLELVMW